MSSIVSVTACPSRQARHSACQTTCTVIQVCSSIAEFALIATFADIVCRVEERPDESAPTAQRLSGRAGTPQASADSGSSV